MPWRGRRTGDDRRTSALSEDKVVRPGDNSQVVAAAREDDERERADAGARENVVARVGADAWRTGRPVHKAMDAAEWWALWDCSRPILDSVSSISFFDSGTISSPGSRLTTETTPGSVSRRPTGIWWS